MPTLNKKVYNITELNEINQKLTPLKDMADRELISIRGLTGMIYTPHVDTYMQVCIEKAEILANLKKQQILPLSEVELVNSILNQLHSRAKHQAVIIYEGNYYQRKFLPLKLSKSGKNVRKWAKFWLLQNSDSTVNNEWENQVREIWPTYFLIRTIEI
ncbi:hypothetical protein AADZ91_00160 [Colwelliaceae bacterium 6441]